MAPSFKIQIRKEEGSPFPLVPFLAPFFISRGYAVPGGQKGTPSSGIPGKAPVSSCKKHPQPLLHKRGFGLFVAVRLHGQMYTSISIPAFLSGPAPCCRFLQNLLPVYSTRKTVSAYVRWTGATPRPGRQGTFAA